MAWLKVLPSLCSSKLIQAIVERVKKRERKRERGRSLLDLVGVIFNEVTFLVMYIRPFISAAHFTQTAFRVYGNIVGDNIGSGRRNACSRNRTRFTNELNCKAKELLM